MFDKDTVFWNATFGEGANFRGATLGEESSFVKTVFSGTSFFSGATFEENTRFTKTTFVGGAYFSHSNFTDGVLFSEAQFEDKSSFYGAHFGKPVIFSKCSFNKPTLFRNPLAIEDLRFQDMTVEQFQNVDFLNCPLKNITFTNVEWPKHPTEDRYCIPMESKPSKLPAVADFYRQMKKRCRDEQNDAEASLWHYAEKEALLKHHRLGKPRSIQRWILESYRIISRYGEDPWQALKVLGWLMGMLALTVGLGALSFHGFDGTAITLERTGKFMHSFLQYALLDKPTYPIPTGFAVAALLLSRLFIPIQAAIFAFALRNKLHR